MALLTSLTNHQVRLASRPVGTATRDNWAFTAEPVTEPADGGVLVKTLALEESRLAVGDHVRAGLGVQEYCLIPAGEIKRNGKQTAR